MKRVFYALGLLACCLHSSLNAGEVDPEKRGGAANQEQRSGSTTGSAATGSASGTGTGAAAGPRKEAKGMSLRQMTGTIVKKDGSELKIKTGASEKTLITDFKTKGIDNAKSGAKVAVRYYEDDGKLRAAEIAPR
jgi:hypothetical protein